MSDELTDTCPTTEEWWERDWSLAARTPTPVPSEVAETTAGEREVEALAKVLFDAAFPGERESDPYWFKAYEVDWRENARAVLASDWLAARLDRVRREEGERIAQVIEDGCDLPATPCRMCRDAALLARAASVGRGEGL